MRISAVLALGLLLGASRCPLAAAGDPQSGSVGLPAANYQDPYAGNYGANYGFSDAAPYSDNASHAPGCATCGCAACSPYGYQGCALGYALRGGLPNPHRSTCDMPQHHYYFAEPKFYYYFRPYNWFHIPVQQDDVRAFGGDPRHPYDNRVFKSVYEQLHFNEPAPEAIGPPATPAAPMTESKPSAKSRSTVEHKGTGKVVPASTSQRAAEPRNVVRIRRVSHTNE